jgi:hypothetical protein
MSLPKNQDITEENLYVNNLKNFDIIPMFNFTNSTFYFSERLVKRLNQEKLTGAVFEEKFHFNFIGDLDIQ